MTGLEHGWLLQMVSIYTRRHLDIELVNLTERAFTEEIVYAASSRFGGGCRQTGTSRSVCFLSIRNNSLSSSSPRAPPPHPLVPSGVMSVAGSFDEAHKRYCLCDFCRRLLVCLGRVPIVIAFSCVYPLTPSLNIPRRPTLRIMGSAPVSGFSWSAVGCCQRWIRRLFAYWRNWRPSFQVRVSYFYINTGRTYMNVS